MTDLPPTPPDALVPLREDEVDPDPLRQFRAWFAEATQAGVAAPEAAALATATGDGLPSVRMVLVKRAEEQGFVFFSNYDSRKGQELAVNPRAALLFYWSALGRQVRVEGSVQRTTAAESEAYVRTRPRGSQLSALASPQSRVIENRTVLEQRVAELASSHPEGDLPLPGAWGGYRLEPVSFEFWQNRADRLHDRLRYQPRPGGGWRLERLAP